MSKTDFFRLLNTMGSDAAIHQARHLKVSETQIALWISSDN